MSVTVQSTYLHIERVNLLHAYNFMLPIHSIKVYFSIKATILSYRLAWHTEK